jgi:hypothetical protein
MKNAPTKRFCHPPFARFGLIHLCSLSGALIARPSTATKILYHGSQHHVTETSATEQESFNPPASHVKLNNPVTGTDGESEGEDPHHYRAIGSSKASIALCILHRLPLSQWALTSPLIPLQAAFHHHHHHHHHHRRRRRRSRPHR